jgi:hypothetical protein
VQRVHSLFFLHNTLLALVTVPLTGQRFHSVSRLQGSFPEPNQGEYVNLNNPWVVGFDGVSLAPCTYILDELVVYRRVRRNQEVRLFPPCLNGVAPCLAFHHLLSRAPPTTTPTFPLSSLWLQFFHDFIAANSPAALASGTIVLPSTNISLPYGQQGAIVAAVSSTTYSVVNVSMFDINNPDTTTAQAQIDAMLAFLNTSAVQDPNNYVVGVAATSKRYRRLLYEYNNHPSTSREVDMHTMYGYFYMNTDSVYKAQYNKTWSGAYQYCMDRGRYLCDQHDYAYTSLYRVAPNVTNLPTTSGTVPVGRACVQGRQSCS